MNTTSLYVEPVFVGVLAILTFGMPFAPDIWRILSDPDLKPPTSIAIGSLAVGAAYLLGIAADRVLDTCLEAIERHNRLRFAWSKLKVWTWVSNLSAWWRDPYPEDELRMQAMIRGGKVADFIDYVRTRVRLMRAAAFFAPGLTIGGVLAVFRAECQLMPLCSSADGRRPPPSCGTAMAWFNSEPAIFAVLVAAPYALYVALPLVVQAGACVARRQRGAGFWRFGLWYPPRSDNAEKMQAYAEGRGWTTMGDASRGLACDLLCQPSIWFALILLLIAGLLSASMGWRSLPMAITLAGAAFTLAAGWAWWRSTWTFMTYLWQHGRHPSASSK